jgi:hypothetical protein
MKVAKDQNKVFVMDTGEGNDFTDPVTGCYIEDFSGWLIDPSIKSIFVCKFPSIREIT